MNVKATTLGSLQQFPDKGWKKKNSINRLLVKLIKILSSVLNGAILTGSVTDYYPVMQFKTNIK